MQLDGLLNKFQYALDFNLIFNVYFTIVTNKERNKKKENLELLRKLVIVLPHRKVVKILRILPGKYLAYFFSQ